MPITEAPKPFKWVGGHLALDFNNTVDWNVLEPDGGEYLSDYGRLVEWGREAGVLSAKLGDTLLSLWTKRPTEAEHAIDQARSARNAIHRIFFGLMRGDPPIASELSALNTFLEQAPAHLGCRYRPAIGHPGLESEIVWSWSSDEADLAAPIWPVVWSAGRLLTSAEVAGVKTCANEQCGWLFLDTSRKHNRKWCEMGVCGNRAKARRYYARHRRRAQSD